MPLQLHPVTSPADIPTLARLHLHAFMLVRINQALYPRGLTPPIIASTEARHLNTFMTDPTAKYLKITDTDADKPIAFAEWHVFPTIASEASRLDLGPKNWPEDVNVSLATEFWSHIIRARQSMQGIPHVFLSIIATDPDQGRRGAGAMLMRWGVEEADRRGLPCFLEASPHGKGLYTKFGFREVEKLGFEVDVSEGRDGSEIYRHAVMVRDAMGKKGDEEAGMREIDER